MIYEATFAVQGKPQGKARHRINKYGIIYTPQKTKTYENDIATEYIIKYGSEKFDGFISIDVLAMFKPPKKTSKKKYNEIENTPYPFKPDGDNILKAVLDALNNVAWKDDCAVVNMSIRKIYFSENKLFIKIKKIFS